MRDKEIFLSYSKHDESIALKIKSILQELFGKQLWLKDFDLNAGDLVMDCISEAVSHARWFILIASSKAIQSKWVKLEADLATFRALNDQDFEIIILKLDDFDIPSHLKIAFSKYQLLDLGESEDIDSDLLDLADYIDKKESTQTEFDMYINRGSEADQLSLLIRKNKILFILGWAGIGKTSFVLNRCTERIRKRPLKVLLSRGHSLDLLARQIIREAKMPASDLKEGISDDELLLYAIQSIKKRSEHFYLFLDEAENGLNALNHVFPYLERLLTSFLKADIKTHIILTTTRFPEYSPEIAAYSSLLKLEPLGDPYIRECIDLWLEGHKNHGDLMRSPEMDDVIKLISGHPLAARMIASYLNARPISDLLTNASKKKFQLRFAEFILREAKRELLSELHLKILYLLSIVQEPLLFEDLISIKEMSIYTNDEIHKARSELVDLFLITQEYELMSLHNFLKAYFHEAAEKNESLFESMTGN